MILQTRGGGGGGSKTLRKYSRVQKNSSVLEFPAFLPPTNLGLPKHSPSALTGHVSLNLAFSFADVLSGSTHQLWSRKGRRKGGQPTAKRVSKRAVRFNSTMKSVNCANLAKIGGTPMGGKRGAGSLLGC